MVDTPESDKVAELQIKSAVLSEFVDWLENNGIELCHYNPDGLRHLGLRDATYTPISTSYETLFQAFFGVDPDKLENERRGMLAEIRLVNKMAERRPK